MSFNDDLERRHYARQAESNQGSKDFRPWALDKVTLNVGETFYARILRPSNGRIYGRKYHWPQGKPPVTCTQDHPAFWSKDLNKGMCSLCEIYPNKSDRAKQKRDDVLEVIDFRYFHIIPGQGGKDDIERCVHDDPDGEIRDNRCHNCNSDDEKVSKRWFGGHKVMELKEYQYNQVWAAHTKLSHTCIAVFGQSDDGMPIICGSKNYLSLFICRHCEEPLMEADTVRRTPQKTLTNFKQNKQRCQCGQVDYPFAIYACESDGSRSRTPSELQNNVSPEEGKHWVTRGSMFDKVLEITVAGETKNLSNGDKITLKNLNVSTGEDWSPVAMDLGFFGFSQEEIEELCKPWDLDHRYRPSFKLKEKEFSSQEDWVHAILEEQAQLVGRQSPFAEDSGGSRSAFGGGEGRRSFRS